MNRIIKILLGIGGTVVGLVIAVMIAAAVLIDPNDYRDKIAEEVKAQTGRDLSISGEIKLSLFPWMGLQLGETALGNARGFGDKPFARIEAADVRVKLLPLLRAQVEMDTLLLRGLEVNLQRRKNGVSNWDDLAGRGTGKPAVAKPKAEVAPDEGLSQLEQTLAGLAIGGIALERANISFIDEMAGQQIVLQDFNFNSGAIRIREAIPLSLETGLKLGKPAMEGTLSLEGELTLDPSTQRYQLSQLSLQTDLKGNGLPGGQLKSQLSGDVLADMGAQSVTVEGLVLEALGLQLAATVRGEQVIDAPKLNGNIALQGFVPRALLGDLGIELPEMADPSTLSKAQLSSNFVAGTDHVALNKLSLQLDDSTLNGQVSVRRFSAPIIRYTLNLDDIDVDRYLPPPAEGQPKSVSKQVVKAPSPGAAVAATTPELPLELMRSLDIDGTLKVGKVKVMNLRSDTIEATLKGNKGRFLLHPLSAQLYEGGYSGDLSLDVSAKQPRLSMDEKLSGVQSGPLLKDFMGKAYVTGRADMQAKLTARGLDDKTVRKTLNGSGRFSFANGEVAGINIGQQLRSAYALYKKQPLPPAQEKKTDFNDLRGSFQVKNGVLTTSDLSASSPLFDVKGKGNVNLPTERLDLLLTTMVVSNIHDAMGEGGGELSGEKIPVTVKGTFSDPKIGVDLESMLKAKLEAKVEKKKQELKAKAKKKVEEKLEQKLEQQLGDKLKNMFKF